MGEQLKINEGTESVTPHRYVILYGQSESTIKTFMEEIKANILRMTKGTAPSLNHPKYDEYNNADRLLVSPKGKNSAYIKIYGPSLAYLSSSKLFYTFNTYSDCVLHCKSFERQHQLQTQFKVELTDSQGNVCRVGTKVGVYFQEDGISPRRIDRITKSSIYFDDRRHIPRKDNHRMMIM